MTLANSDKEWNVNSYTHIYIFRIICNISVRNTPLKDSLPARSYGAGLSVTTHVK